MKLSQQVTSVKLSNKLKDLNVYEPSLFFRDYRGSKEEEIDQNTEPSYNIDNVNCYTVAELGEMLPRYLVRGEYSCELTIIRSSVWRFYYGIPDKIPESVCLTAKTNDTEADARAKMLIYLIENNLFSTNK